MYVLFYGCPKCVIAIFPATLLTTEFNLHAEKPVNANARFWCSEPDVRSREEGAISSRYFTRPSVTTEIAHPWTSSTSIGRRPRWISNSG